MALALLRIEQRSPTRFRLRFDGALASGAFGPSSLAGYTAAESYDGSAVAARTWAMSGAIAIISDPAAVELVLSLSVSDGAWFWVIFNAAVPAISGPPFAGALSPTIRTAEKVPAPSPEVPTSELDAIIWGEDFIFRDGRWVESSSGDMLVETGMGVAVHALERRQISEGLLWDPSYGLRPRRFVDAPTVNAPAIAGEAQAQAVADDRVVAALSVVGESRVPDEVLIETRATFFSGQTKTVSTSLRK